MRLSDDDFEDMAMTILASRREAAARRRRHVALTAWLAAAVALAVLGCLLLAPARGAPAHVYREPAPLSTRVLGSWVCDWGSLRGTCELSPQGFWACEFGGMH